MMETASILWRRLDLPGHESARVIRRTPGWSLEGSAVFAFDQQPCRLDYQVSCTAGWETTAAHVSGWVGPREIEIDITVDDARRWSLNGREISGVAGCVDVDLNFSPITNLLPIRRLELPIGEEQDVRAAWLVFPSFELEPLEQVYRRLESQVYHYQSRDGSFVRDLRLSRMGLVLEYPGFWQAEAIAEV